MRAKAKFQATRFYFFLLPAFFLLSFTANSLYAGASEELYNSINKIITGRVLDEDGNPLRGVTIKVKNAATTAITNEAGEFSIDAADNAVLQISYVGFETLEISASQASKTITLKKSSNELQDVVVIGYGSKKAKYLSSAAAVVSGEKLRDVTSNNISSLLQGKVAGLVVSTGSGDPTSGSNILIRGAGTISAGSAPLVVVDGNIGGSYNPTDVESITVLKDAAATGLYGSRAGNGVLIITTKSGKAGKTKIDLQSSIGFNKANTGNFELMNGPQLFEYLSEFSTPDPAMKNTNTNWWDLAFRSSMTQSHTLSASGGSDKTQFYISGNYYKEEGTLIANDKTAYNFRTNITHKVNSKLKVSTLLNGIYTKDNYNPEGGLYQAYTYLPFDSAYGANGLPVDSRYVNWYGRDESNFLYSMQYNFSEANSLNLNGDLNLEYQLTKNLSVGTYNRINFFNYRSRSFYDKRSQGGAANGGELYNSSSQTREMISSNRLRFDKSFGVHNLSALAVAEANQSFYEVLSTAVKGLPPGRPFASTATGEISLPQGGVNEYSFHKYLGQVDYNFNNKYFAVASLVRDRSSRFGNNNSGATFYQLGASWILTNEEFLKGNKLIDFLKLRASYGTTGNAEIGDYAALGLYSLSTASSYAGLPGAAPLQKANPDLTWEKQKSINLGVEINFKKRVSVTVDIYQKTSDDLLYRKPLPATTGYLFVYENIGSVRNRGLEFSIVSQNIKQKNFSWETSLNMAFNRNKVISLNDGQVYSSPGARQPIGVGHDMDEWNMPVWAGVDPANGDPLWEKVLFDADGKKYITYTNDYNSVANETSRQYLGKSAAPKFTGGITNEINFKGFTLSAFVNFVYGNYVFNDTRFYYDNDGNYDSYNSMVLPSQWTRWKNAGDIATHPRPLAGGNKLSMSSSSRYLEDGSYIRLRNITLGYNLPSAFLQRYKISNARIFVSGDNLWTGTNFTGPDPEVVLSAGESSFKYPLSKKVMVGINLSF
ncbi:MAG: TonB-dependent receptor [Sphingobacteriales bacterium]|nr:MAG: TonB-dependent receptor [Sphingobacteriales bacterium]